jgi:hypothetical protein
MMTMLYPTNKSTTFYIRSLWVTQKNIEVEEKWALKREEQERKIKKNNILNGQDRSS